MHSRVMEAAGTRFPGIGLVLAASLAAATLSACGAGTSASQLVKQTFSASHTMTSADVEVGLTVTPSGSTVLTSPITLSFSGPFQDSGKGRIPDSDITLSLSSSARSLLSVGVESLAGRGYVSLGGRSYSLPAGTYAQLESSLAKTGSGSFTSSGVLGKLGIDPLHWLVDPTVAGRSTVAGVSTTHIRAGVDMRALLDDLGTFLGKASSLGIPDAGKLSTSISASTEAKIIAAVRQPTVDVWTGTDDEALRKLAVSLTIPVTGKVSNELGGLKSAAVSLVILYRNLNQPQRISAPTSVGPYRQFQARVQSLVAAIRSAVTGSLAGSTTTGSTTGSAGAAAPSAAGGAAPNAYSRCITAAKGHYRQMYKCAPLLSGGN